MTLIDRYLRSVREYLPSAGQADIIRELSEDLHAQVADRQEELGRPLTEGEQEAILKQYGHPLLLASKYRPQRHLIGPALFPFYVLALKLSLGISLVVHAGLTFSLLLTGAPLPEILAPLARFPFGAGLTIFGLVTIGFAIADMTIEGTRPAGRWNPRTLASGPKVPPRLQLIFEVVATTAFFVWWLAIPQYPFLLLGPAAAFTTLGPVFDRLYVPITLLWLLSLVALWSLLLQTAWLRYRDVARIVMNLAGVVVASLFLGADRLVVPASWATADLVKVVGVIETSGRVGLAVYIAFCWVEIVKAAWRLRRRPIEV